MESSRIRPGIAEVTEQAFARRHGLEEDPPRRWWHIRTRIIVMTIICVVIGSLIVYWFISSILENQRDNSGSKSKKASFLQLERLPRQVLPLEYTLKILPLLEDGNFTAIGDVQIQLRCIVPTKRIRLHAHGLRIKEISFKEFQSTGGPRMISEYIAIAEDFVDIYLMQLLAPRESYMLRVKYSLQLAEEARGLFRTSYHDTHANETRWIAVSNFSPDYARRAFPCFDEPWIKTPFRISIGRSSRMRSHSNSLQKLTEEMHDMPGYVWDHYEKSLPMSTYVVAFMVTDFASFQSSSIERPYHTIFARKDVLRDTRYLGHLVPRVLRVIQNLTAFHYEPDKLDVIVVPKLAYSAMENWGLITFGENSIVQSSDHNTIDYKRLFASTVAHEVAHQWFGNLVTPAWWDDVWLKEGFSSFFGYFALSRIEPFWDLQTAFALQFRDILESSGFETAHSLHLDLNRLRRLDSVFDETSYVMGNCVVYMLFNSLGERTFLSSIREYVRSHYYRSVDEQTLWSTFQVEVERVGGFPGNLSMTDIMKTWTRQAGVPILRVERNRESGTVAVKQDRFRNYETVNSSGELWYIPLTWTTQDYQPIPAKISSQVWMTKRTMEINDPSLTRAILDNHWILFNANQTALHRTNYDLGNWHLLAREFPKLPKITKAQLLDDAFAIAKAGLLEHSVPWSILESLEVESDELLWSTAMVALTSIHHGLWDSSAFKILMCRLVSRAYTFEAASLVNSGPELWSCFKVKLMKLACLMAHKDCIRALRTLTWQIMRNESSTPIPPNYRLPYFIRKVMRYVGYRIAEEYRTLIYCAYVRTVNEEEWESLFERYRNDSALDRHSLAYALGCHSNTTILRRYLLMLLENNAEDRYTEQALISAISNPYGLKAATSVFTRYWDRKAKSREELSRQQFFNARGIDALMDVLHAFAIYMDREEHVAWLQYLKGKNNDIDTVIDEVISRVRINIAWNKNHKTETLRVVEALAKKQKESHECAKSTEDERSVY